MNTQSNAIPGSFQAQAVTPVSFPESRLLYWSVRRELWEYRSIYIAPLVVAGVFLVGFMISLVHLPNKMRAALALDAMQQHKVIEQPYMMVAFLVMGIAFVVGVFYSLDALHSERRERSLLFWKSLPVSDLTTVLSKFSIPVVVLPLVSFTITVAAQWIMLMLSSLVLLGSGLSVATLWTQVALGQMSMTLLYHLVTVHALWYAPIYGWLLLVSGWARRATFLWAAVPLFAIGMLERVAFNTSHFAKLLQYRVAGPETYAMASRGDNAMSAMAPVDLGKFLGAPGLWLGLLVAAAFLAGAVRLRRSQGPI
jgi:ABC-2 type transport system permease protein